MKIVSSPKKVCVEHALEFWTGLLAYARARSGTLKHDPSCTCRSCQELGAAYLQAIALAAAGSSPRYHERFPLRLAS